MVLGLPRFSFDGSRILNRAFPAVRIGGGRKNAWSYTSLLFVGTLEVSGVFVPIVKRRVSP